MSAPPVILASGSAIRLELLRAAGVMCSARRPTVDEDQLKQRYAAMPPAGLAQALARDKALSISRTETSALVIGADQVLNFQGRPYGKPEDLDEARARLRAMRGARHILETAVCCAVAGSIVWSHLSQPELLMRACSDHFLDNYLAQAGPVILASAGAYQLEHQGIQLFERIDGDYFAILGLPLLPLLQFLRESGVLMP